MRIAAFATPTSRTRASSRSRRQSSTAAQRMDDGRSNGRSVTDPCSVTRRITTRAVGGMNNRLPPFYFKIAGYDMLACGG